jgi:hypothetical protein
MGMASRTSSTQEDVFIFMEQAWMWQGRYSIGRLAAAGRQVQRETWISKWGSVFWRSNETQIDFYGDGADHPADLSIRISGGKDATDFEI